MTSPDSIITLCLDGRCTRLDAAGRPLWSVPRQEPRHFPPEPQGTAAEKGRMVARPSRYSPAVSDITAPLSGEPLPAAPFAAGSATSHAAAVAIAPIAGLQAARVLAWLRQRGSHGATRDEIADALRLGPQSACPRVLELIRTGSVRETTATRPTRSGRAACVLVAVGAEEGELPL